MCSDQQLITGLAISIATRYFSSRCTISAYHYDLVCYYLLCSITTHLVSWSVVNSYFEVAIGKGGWSSLASILLALVRVLGVAATVIITGMIFDDRDPTSFPLLLSNPPDPNLKQLAACYYRGKSIVPSTSFRCLFAIV